MLGICSEAAPDESNLYSSCSLTKPSSALSDKAGSYPRPNQNLTRRRAHAAPPQQRYRLDVCRLTVKVLFPLFKQCEQIQAASRSRLFHQPLRRGSENPVNV